MIRCKKTCSRSIHFLVLSLTSSFIPSTVSSPLNSLILKSLASPRLSFTLQPLSFTLHPSACIQPSCCFILYHLHFIVARVPEFTSHAVRDCPSRFPARFHPTE